MNPKKTLVLILALLLCPWLAETASAQRRGSSPRIQPSTPPPAETEERETTRARPRMGRVTDMAAKQMPNLACSIVVTENEYGPGGKTVTTDGGTFAYGGGDPSVWARVSVKNVGSAYADQSSTKIVVRRDGHVIEEKTLPTFGVQPGGTPYMDPFKVEIDLASKSHQYQVSAVTDLKGDLTESNENNNDCSLSFSATVVQ